MARWSFSNPSWTPTVVGNAATMTANGACFLLCSSTQFITTKEIYIAGHATASAPMQMVVARDSTIAAASITLGTNGSNAPLTVHTAALAAPQTPGFSATTMPQRNAAFHLLQPGFNAFGGIVRLLLDDKEELTQYGTAVNVGELSLSAHTGSTASTLIQTHWIYEPD